MSIHTRIGKPGGFEMIREHFIFKYLFVSLAIFLKTDAAGRLFILIFIQQKIDAGTFFFEIQRIFFGNI